MDNRTSSGFGNRNILSNMNAELRINKIIGVFVIIIYVSISNNNNNNKIT